MTTTAEKINRIVQDLAILRDDIQRLDVQVKDIIAEAESKPADPEPLECWVAHQDGNLIGASRAEPEVTGRVNKTFVREVTPQDEQDRKDARIYREWIEFMGGNLESTFKDAARFRRLMEMDGVGWQEGGEGWTALIPGRVLREAIDKEMEDK